MLPKSEYPYAILWNATHVCSKCKLFCNCMTWNAHTGCTHKCPIEFGGVMDIAEKLTKERGEVYGDPSIQLKCAAELKEVYRKYSVGISAHDEAMESVLLKISRIACGKYHVDNYDDVMGYIKIAKELGGTRRHGIPLINKV